MKTTSKLIRSVIILAAIVVILFALFQLTQHGYDVPLQNEHLIVDIHHDVMDGPYSIHRRNIASLSQREDIESRFNSVEQQLEQQKNALTALNNRLQALEQNAGIDEDGPTNIIYDNPLNQLQCQNAILDLENIDIENLISVHTPSISCTKHQNWRPHIWTREGVGALLKHRCYRPHTPIRTTNDYMDIIKNNKSLAAKNKDSVPVYYHMPKCASSSTAGMLSDHFDFQQHWMDGPETNHQTVYTDCGFTFVRNPIHRFISGYYTINNMIWRDCLDVNGAKSFSNHTRNKYDKYKFVSIIGEPERFETYIDEMFDDPYLFGKTLPFRHSGSQMYFLSNWYGSDIQFFGRVEKFEQHWNVLLQSENCEWFKQNMEIESISVPNSMYHYGFYGPTLWAKSNGEKKEYVDALGIRANLEKMHRGKIENRIDPNDILAPAYYFITKQTYKKIVEYFWQDFICFGYPTDYKNFQKYVSKFINPNET